MNCDDYELIMGHVKASGHPPYCSLMRNFYCLAKIKDCPLDLIEHHNYRCDYAVYKARLHKMKNDLLRELIGRDTK